MRACSWVFGPLLLAVFGTRYFTASTPSHACAPLPVCTNDSVAMRVASISIATAAAASFLGYVLVCRYARSVSALESTCGQLHAIDAACLHGSSLPATRVLHHCGLARCSVAFRAGELTHRLCPLHAARTLHAEDHSSAQHTPWPSESMQSEEFIKASCHDADRHPDGCTR